MERQPGYYWVKDSAGWQVAEWGGNMWECGDAALTDNYFSEINESRIPAPGETVVCPVCENPVDPYAD